MAKEGQPRKDAMLVLERFERQKIFIGKDITLVVVRIDKDAVRLGIEAPEDVAIWREEIYNAKLKKFLEDRAEEE